MIVSKSKRIIAFLLNLLLAPGFGELYTGQKHQGKKYLIYYTLWSILALILTIVSIGILIPVLLMIDTAIRIVTACDIYIQNPNSYKPQNV